MLKSRFTLIITLILTMMFSPVWAKGNEIAAAEQRVLGITTSIVKKLDANKAQFTANPALLTAMIRKEVLPFIDFQAMSKLTLGKHWKKASKPQRARFVNAFREMLVRSYGKAMLKYTGATIRGAKSVAGRKPGYVTVRTLVTPRGSSAIAANYDVRNKSGDWKAYNIQIAGISLITNFRTSFTREASAKGIDALIARLEKKK